MRIFALLLLPASLLFCALNVPLEVSNWADIARTAEPVSQGVCLPAGAIYDISKLQITDALGRNVPAQFRPLTKWWVEKNRDNIADPSLKWVLCDFQADVAAQARTQFFLKDDNLSSPGSDLSVTEDASGVTVITGPLKFTLSKTAFNLFDEAWLDLNGSNTFEADERIIISSAQNGALATAGDWAAGECVAGTVHQSSLHAPERIVVEEQGPMKIVLRVEGRHYASSNSVTRGLYGYQAFITAYAGKPYVDVQWAITNLYMEGDKPGQTGTADPYEVFVWPLREYLLNFNLNLGATQTQVLLAQSEISSAASGTPARLFQDSAGFTVTGGASDTSALGAVALTDGSKGLMIGLRDFAVTNPKAISVSQGKISLELFPNTGERHWLDPYTRKNQRMRLKFFSGAYAGGSLLNLHKETNAPLRMLAPREWYQRCNAWYRGFGIPPATNWERKAPASWTRLGQAATQPVKHLPDNEYSPVNWTSYGQIEEFNGAGDHWNLTSCFYNYLLTGNPREFEYPEASVFHFNDVVPVQFSWYDDPWVKLDWFLGAENHLSGLNNYHGPTNNIIFNGTYVAFPGWAYHRGNKPDDGHMTQLEILEYYQLTGDLATLDAIRAHGAHAIASIFGYAYFSAGRFTDRKIVLDSVYIMPWQQRYIARPGIVCQHAYEVTGDDRYLYPAQISAYSLRNYTRQNPVGYMGKPDDRSYLDDDAGMLAIWQVKHPSDTDFPRSFAANDFMIGIAEESMYGYVGLTGDREIRDALIFSSKSHEWRSAMSGSTYTGFIYAGYGDYLQEGRRYHESVNSNGDYFTGDFTTSMAEGLGGMTFGYLMSGRSDLWKVITDATPSHNPAGFDSKVINLWQAYFRHDSLDNVAPARVTDLAAAFEDGAGVRLNWTAPGDDGATGTAKEYQIKFGPTPIVDIPDRWDSTSQTGWPDMRAPLPYTAEALVAKAENYKNSVEISFWAARNVSANPAPQAGGTPESFLVTELDTMTAYYAALVAYDEVGNVSDISNVVTVTTGAELGKKGTERPVLLVHPNPFNPMVSIRLSGFRERAVALIFEPTGRLVSTLALDKGLVKWDAGKMPSGLYLIEVRAGAQILRTKAILLK